MFTPAKPIMTEALEASETIVKGARSIDCRIVVVIGGSWKKNGSHSFDNESVLQCCPRDVSGKRKLPAQRPRPPSPPAQIHSPRAGARSGLSVCRQLHRQLHGASRVQ